VRRNRNRSRRNRNRRNAPGRNRQRPCIRAAARPPRICRRTKAAT